MYNKLLKASLDKYQAQKSEAIAHLDILFKNSVGIGEHTDILVEVDKWVKSLAEADENLEILGRYFDEYGESKGGEVE
tara:strand:- start:263 stop:496 length:234 start_codon:yes stop_codon:yes gene_type:complete